MKLPKHDPALPVVAFDFDGTLVANRWPSPEIGDTDWAAVRALLHYRRMGCEVVIFTARPVSHFARIWAWLEEHALASYVYDVTNVKPNACLFFDDRAVRWPPAA